MRVAPDTATRISYSPGGRSSRDNASKRCSVLAVDAGHESSRACRAMPFGRPPGSSAVATISSGPPRVDPLAPAAGREGVHTDGQHDRRLARAGHRKRRGVHFERRRAAGNSPVNASRTACDTGSPCAGDAAGSRGSRRRVAAPRSDIQSAARGLDGDLMEFAVGARVGRDGTRSGSTNRSRGKSRVRRDPGRSCSSPRVRRYGPATPCRSPCRWRWSLVAVVTAAARGRVAAP